MGACAAGAPSGDTLYPTLFVEKRFQISESQASVFQSIQVRRAWRAMPLPAVNSRRCGRARAQRTQETEDTVKVWGSVGSLLFVLLGFICLCFGVRGCCAARDSATTDDAKPIYAGSSTALIYDSRR
jgi:hypothetical protein